MGYRSVFNFFLTYLPHQYIHNTQNLKCNLFNLYYGLLDFFKKELKIVNFLTAIILLSHNFYFIQSRFNKETPGWEPLIWVTQFTTYTPASTSEEPLCIVNMYRFTWLISWLYNSVVCHGCSFRLKFMYTDKHSPGLPSSFSDLMPPTVPAPAGSTVSAGVSSHSKKIQLTHTHLYTVHSYCCPHTPP